MNKKILNNRVVSGMRPTGMIHLGHYHGVIKNWIQLQNEHECFFFIADWHALTTDYNKGKEIHLNNKSMVIDWLSAGIDHSRCKIFIQSEVPELAELYILLSMLVPVGWLQRMPSYKDNVKIKGGFISYGFFGYPVLQSSDILIYKANFVPIGVDQISHIELSKKIAKKLNYLSLGDSDLQIDPIIKKINFKKNKSFSGINDFFLNMPGDYDEKKICRFVGSYCDNILNMDEKEILIESIVDKKKQIIFPDPQALLTKSSKIIGIDGRKMSKTYGNSIFIAENPNTVKIKINKMVTDPSRKRRFDSGDASKCSVWILLSSYMSIIDSDNIKKDCSLAKIGCVECKKLCYSLIISDSKSIISNKKEISKNFSFIDKILKDGKDAARSEASNTLKEVKRIIGIKYK